MSRSYKGQTSHFPLLRKILTLRILLIICILNKVLFVDVFENKAIFTFPWGTSAAESPVDRLAAIKMSVTSVSASYRLCSSLPLRGTKDDPRLVDINQGLVEFFELNLSALACNRESAADHSVVLTVLLRLLTGGCI